MHDEKAATLAHDDMELQANNMHQTVLQNVSLLLSIACFSYYVQRLSILCTMTEYTVSND